MSIPPYDRSKTGIAESFQTFIIDPCPPSPSIPFPRGRRPQILQPLRQFSRDEIVNGHPQRPGQQDHFQVRNASDPGLDVGNAATGDFKTKYEAAGSKLVLVQFRRNRRTCGPTIFLDDFVRCPAMNWRSKQVGAREIIR